MTLEDRRANKRWYAQYQKDWDSIPTFVAYTTLVGSLRSLSSDPKWREKVSSGKDATLPYTNTSYKWYRVSGSAWAQPKPHRPPLSRRRYSTVSGGIPLFRPVPSGLEKYAVAKAATYVIKDIREAQASVDTLTIAGELRETLRMLRSPARALRMASGQFLFDVHDRLRRDKALRRNPVLWERVLAESWLELSLGVKPFVSDIKTALDAAIEIDLARVKRLRGVGGDSATEIIQATESTMIGANWDYEQVWLHKSFCKYVCGVMETDNTDRSPFQRLSDKSKFDWADVVPAAYELLPWSFVLDYFYDLGSVLSTSFVSLRDVVWSSKTMVSTTHYHRQRDRIRGITDTGSVSYFASRVPEVTGEKTSIVRTKEYPSASLDALRLTLPPVGAKWLNLSALATQLFSR